MKDPATPSTPIEPGGGSLPDSSERPVAIKLSWLQLALMVAGLVGLGAIEVALYMHFSDLTGWPEAYGIECRRKCWGAYLFHSPRLLLRNDPNEFALFAVLWSVIWVPALVLFPISKQLRARRR